MPLETFRWPRAYPRSWDFELRVNGEPVDVLDSRGGAFALFDGDGPAHVELRAVRRAEPLASAVVRPLRHALVPELDDRRLRFVLTQPADVVIESPGLPDLFLFYGASGSSDTAPPVGAEHIFRAGQVYEVGVLNVRAGERVHIEGGAVLKGSLRLEHADGASVSGRGIVDGDCFDYERNALLVEHSDGVSVRGVTFVNPVSWTVKIAACQNVVLDGVRVLAEGNARDGIDLVGSQNVAVTHCFVRAADDCVAVKSAEYGHPASRPDYCRDVENVRVEDSALLSYGGGSAMELGHEFRCERVRNVAFRRMDILGVHQYGSAFSIRNCDAALIENVLYEDIRVEHHYNELIGFRIIKSRYSKSPTRGRVRGVTLRRVQVDLTPHNPGYSLSHLGGYDADHAFEDVLFEDFRYGGQRVARPDDFDLYVKHTRGLVFR